MNRALLAAAVVVPAVLVVPARAAAAAPPRAVADFDRDGYGDLAVGVPGYGRGGAVVVLYGTAGGLRTAGAQLWTQDSPGVPGGVDGTDAFGAAVATGDFDRDGYSDLAVGAPDENGYEGVAHVIYGSARGLTGTGSELWQLDTPGVPGASTGYEHFGSALTTGDFDGDGRDDLAIAGRGGSEEHGSAAGGVWVMRGTSGGLRPGPALRDPLGSPSSAFGAALAAGDFDGNGTDDLAVGAVGQAVTTAAGAQARAGRVWVYSGAAGSGVSATRRVVFDQQSSGVVGTAETGDQFGYALAAGDLDGNGAEDLAVGVPYEDVDAGIDAGAVHVLRGSAGGLTGRGQLWHQDVSGVPGRVSSPGPSTEEGPDLFGAALAAADFNRDGRADLAIGAPEDPVPARGSTGATQPPRQTDGTVTVLRGGGTGLTTSGAQYWHENVPGVPGVAEEDQFGSSLGVGDFDGDRRRDLAIGVPWEQVNAADRSQGAAVVLHSGTGGLTTSGAQQWHQDVPGVPGDGRAFDRFGWALAGGR